MEQWFEDEEIQRRLVSLERTDNVMANLPEMFSSATR
jgi:hypothetical protein